MGPYVGCRSALAYTIKSDSKRSGIFLAPLRESATYISI